MLIFGRRLLLTALLFLGVVLPGVATAAMENPGRISCNGSSALCDRKLNEIVLPGSHNSMAAKELDWFNPNQTYSIPNQLRRGARAMLIDTYYGRKEPNGQVKNVGAGPGDTLYLCHSSCQFGASELVPELEKIVNFLKANPDEVLVFVNEDSVAPGDFAEAVEASGLLEFVYRGPTGPWPTLREMIASNQRVVMTAERNATGVDWYHRAYDGSVRETPYSFDEDPTLLSAPENLAESCRANRGEAAATDDSLFLMNHWISSSIAISGSFAPNIEYAELVNRKDVLIDRAQACQERRGFLPNILAVDFFGTGDVVGAARQINGVAAEASLRSGRVKAVRTRAGRSKVITVRLSNTGDAPAGSVRVCATLPARLAGRPACVKLGELRAGAVRLAKIRVSTKRTARGRGTVEIRIGSSAGSLSLNTQLTVTPARRTRSR